MIINMVLLSPGAVAFGQLRRGIELVCDLWKYFLGFCHRDLQLQLINTSLPGG